MKHPPERLRRFPPLSSRFALRVGGQRRCPPQVRAWRSLAWPAPRPLVALVLLTAVALLLSACGHTGRSVSNERRLDDALKDCRAKHQRVQLFGANGTTGQQGGYTNIQDSSGQRQLEMSNPAGNGAGWYRCVS